MPNTSSETQENAGGIRDPLDKSIAPPPDPCLDLDRARELASQGNFDEAIGIFDSLFKHNSERSVRAEIVSDLATIHALLGNLDTARSGFREALLIDPKCETALQNLKRLDSSPKIKVAILSFLFNWPSTGGGIVHTVELAQFLGEAGYIIQHFFARYSDWGIGQVNGEPSFASRPIEFDEDTWHAAAIQERFRTAVDGFAPDYVIITDSWNFKPLLAEAVRHYPYLLRLQAMECICPLTNVRLLIDENGQPQQCQRQQFAEPEACRRCVGERGAQSGRLHQLERALSGVGTRAYHERLLRSFREAEAVLVVNPLTAAIVAPFCKQVRVVTAGMNSRRFPPGPKQKPLEAKSPSPTGHRIQLFFAGIVEEYMKGFHVLHQACSLLQQRRNDFELVATGDPPGQRDQFTRFIGWLSQEQLAAHLQTTDILVMPTIAQEALGRTAVEAMAAGRPVVASRLGGLPFTLRDGITGLLCRPGDHNDLADKIEFLLDNPTVREQMGRRGRERFEEEYAWETIIQRHYVPFLCRKRVPASGIQSLPGNGNGTGTEPPVETPNQSKVEATTIQLSLIVAVLESYEVVRRQLRHLNKVMTPDCELILVDDGSSPSLQETCESVAKTYPFRLIMTHDTRDWTQPKARNIGAAAARGRKLLFFDIDHIVTTSIIESALKFEGDKLHWVRHPGILDERGEIVTDEMILQGHGLRDSSSSIHLNSFVIRRELFETLGGYDERFCGSYGGDDVDFNGRYERLCEMGHARSQTVAGEGYAYPDPAFNGGRTFHRLPRISANSSVTPS
jgi:glycosyltransferase involved in cell wall biosynthesis